jgi:drug/metabolite transporter (DMT)-like permease
MSSIASRRLTIPNPLAAASPALRVGLALAVIYVVWGSTFAAIRVTVETVPPWLATGARFLVAGAILLAAVAARGGLARLRRLGGRRVAANAGLGLLLVTFGNGLLMVAERDVPSNLAALVGASIPLWVVVLRRLDGERVAASRLATVAVGFGGVALLLLSGGGVGAVSGALLLVVLADLAWAWGSHTGSRLDTGDDVLLGTAVQMLAGGTAALVLGLGTGEARQFDAGAVTGASLLALAYLVVFGSVVAFSTYGWLLRHAPLPQVATHAYVNPLVAVALGSLLLGEPVSGLTLLAGAVIVGSIVATLAPERPRRRFRVRLSTPRPAAALAHEA